MRVGLVDGQYLINPTFEQRKVSKIDIIVAGTMEGLVMVEAGAKEVTEEQVVEALEAAHAAIKKIVAAIDEMAAAVGKKKATVTAKEVDATFAKEVEDKVLGKLTAAMRINQRWRTAKACSGSLAQKHSSRSRGAGGELGSR